VTADPYRNRGSREEAPASSEKPSSEAPQPKRKRARETYSAIPARNFTLTTDDRVRALVAGPPAFAIRRRRIEDLETRIVKKLRALAEKTGALPLVLPPLVERDRAQLNRLVEDHNRYYPIEANLPANPLNGEPMDGSTPFVPMILYTAEALLKLAARTDEEEIEQGEE